MREAMATDTLVHVEVRTAVPFDDDRSVFGDCNVPADDLAIIKGAVCSLGEILGRFPERKSDTLDRGMSVGVRR